MGRGGGQGAGAVSASSLEGPVAEGTMQTGLWACVQHLGDSWVGWDRDFR